MWGWWWWWKLWMWLLVSIPATVIWWWWGWCCCWWCEWRLCCEEAWMTDWWWWLCWCWAWCRSRPNACDSTQEENDLPPTVGCADVAFVVEGEKCWDLILLFSLGDSPLPPLPLARMLGHLSEWMEPVLEADSSFGLVVGSWGCTGWNMNGHAWNGNETRGLNIGHEVLICNLVRNWWEAKHKLCLSWEVKFDTFSYNRTISEDRQNQRYVHRKTLDASNYLRCGQNYNLSQQAKLNCLA